MSIFNAGIERNATGELKKEDKNEYIPGITPVELQDMLKRGIVHFKYRKKAKKGQPFDSGAVRDAWGTKLGDVITKVSHGGYCPPKAAGYSIYFDLEKEDWRAFSDALLLGAWSKVFDEEGYHQELARIEKEKEKEKIPADAETI